MKKLAFVGAALMLGAAAVTASAQTKTITGQTQNITVTVEAIDHANRQVTAKKPDGTYEVFYVPAAIQRFDQIKVGDKITAKYYENMVLRVQEPGAKPVDETSHAVTRAEGTAGTAAHQRTITATIAAIDRNVPSITFTGPNGWKYSSRVQDKEALAKVKVGDKVDITWTEAMILSLEP
jgi:hypothetical protein